VVAKLNAQINQSLNTPALKARLASEGAVAAPATPEVFAVHIAREIARWQPVIKSGRVKAD
jgi:tripartite-type tricarboxylate transporter receptor subunit TctC